MPQTAWSIMIRMSTNSTVPKLFASLSAEAAKAGEAVEAAQKALADFAAVAGESGEQVDALTGEVRGLSGSFTGASRSAARFSKITAEAAATASAGATTVEGAQARMDTSVLKSNKALDFAHKAMIGIGLTAAVTFAVGVKGASDLQNATLQAAVALGRMGGSLDQTMEKMGDFQQVAFNMSKITGQSLSDSMNVIATMASSGLNANQIKAASTPIAQFGDLLRYGKDHMAYAQSATLGAGLVHDLRLGLSNNDKQNAADTSYGLARIAQLGYLSPHGATALTTQIRRFAPAFENILPGTTRQKADTIVKTAAWVDRMGSLPFGGSALAQLLTQIVMPRSSRVMDSMVKLGVYGGGQMEVTPAHRYRGKLIPASEHMVGAHNLFWNDKTGQLDFMGAIQQISRTLAAARKAGKAGPAEMALFGNTQNATRILTALSSKEAQQAWKNLNAQMSGMGADPVAWMAKTQTQVMSTLSGTVGKLTSNLQTMSTLLTAHLIPALKAIVNVMQLKVGGFDQWLIDHPTTAKLGGEALLAGGVAGILALLKAGHNVIHFFAMLGKNPHFGTWVSESAGSRAATAAKVAETGAEVGSDAVKGAEVVGFVGMIGRALTGPLGVLVKGFGSKLIPVVSELGLLYGALQVLVFAFSWVAKLLHLKQPRKETHATRVVRNREFAPAVVPSGAVRHNYHQNPNAVRTGWAPATNVHHTFGKLEITGASVANMSAQDKHDLAEMISEKLAAKVARESAYSHGGTQSVHLEQHGVSNYHSTYGVPRG